MDRITVRGKGRNVYLTGYADVCWGGRPVRARAFCTGCHGAKDNRDVDRSKCGPLILIDRLAAYEDTGLTPEEAAEYQHLCETYVEAGLDSKFVQACIDATKRGVTIGQILELGLPNDPLTLEELREMDGEPVWVVIAGMGRYAVIQHCGEWSTKFTDGMEPPNDRYGTYWLAYRRKLEEGTT